MGWNLEPIVYAARYYEPGQRFEDFDPFRANATIQVLGGRRAFLANMHGTMSLTMRRELALALKSVGIVRVEALVAGELATWDSSGTRRSLSPF